jgi:hypothetical protein
MYVFPTVWCVYLPDILVRHSNCDIFLLLCTVEYTVSMIQGLDDIIMYTHRFMDQTVCGHNTNNGAKISVHIL